MATAPNDATEPTLVLTPPDPVPEVRAEKAAGLVPVDDTKRSELERRVDAFVEQLVNEDVNSPEFGKRVDAITAMGQKEIRDAAGQSNRFLDRPVRAMDQEAGVGKDLAELPLLEHTAADAPYEIELPLTSVARGDYLIAITATAGADSARAFVPVRVIR